MPTQFLRRGANALQGLISSSKRKRNKVAVTPHGLQKINEMDSSSDENTGAHHQHLIQRHHRTQWKLRNRREKRGSRVEARLWNSHLFENRNRYVHVHSTSCYEQCTASTFELDGRLRSWNVRHKQHHQFKRHDKM